MTDPEKAAIERPELAQEYGQDHPWSAFTQWHKDFHVWGRIVWPCKQPLRCLWRYTRKTNAILDQNGQHVCAATQIPKQSAVIESLNNLHESAFALEIAAGVSTGAEPRTPGTQIADSILRRIAKRYENCEVHIYHDMPCLTPVEAVLRCAQEEGFVLTNIVPTAPNPSPAAPPMTSATWPHLSLPPTGSMSPEEPPPAEVDLVKKWRELSAGEPTIAGGREQGAKMAFAACASELESWRVSRTLSADQVIEECAESIAENLAFLEDMAAQERDKAKQHIVEMLQAAFKGRTLLTPATPRVTEEPK